MCDFKNTHFCLTLKIVLNNIPIIAQGCNALLFHLISSAWEQQCMGSKPEGGLPQALDDQIV